METDTTHKRRNNGADRLKRYGHNANATHNQRNTQKHRDNAEATQPQLRDNAIVTQTWQRHVSDKNA
eukprot:11156849-Lingulodinium_polyedra.AAC.1